MDSPLDKGALNFRWLLRLRWGAAFGQLALVLGVQAGLELRLPFVALELVIGLELLSNLLLTEWARRSPHLLSSVDGAENAIACVVAADFALLTVLLALSGGPNNPFTVLYLVEVTLAAVMLAPRRTWVLMGLALACFGVLFATPRFAWFAAHGLSHEQMMDLHIRGMWVAFGVAAAFIVVFVQRVTRALAERDRELASARNQAVRQERLASLATLAAGAAHELSTPLSTIAVVARELERQLAQAAPERPPTRASFATRWSAAGRRCRAWPPTPEPRAARGTGTSRSLAWWTRPWLASLAENRCGWRPTETWHNKSRFCR